MAKKLLDRSAPLSDERVLLRSAQPGPVTSTSFLARLLHQLSRLLR